jgi:hypothetical protein
MLFVFDVLLEICCLFFDVFHRRLTAEELQHHEWLRHVAPKSVADLVARGSELVSAAGSRDAAMHAAVQGGEEKETFVLFCFVVFCFGVVFVFFCFDQHLFVVR